MEDNIMQMPSKLDRLAIRIKDDLKKIKAHDDGKIEATIDMCVALAEARDEFMDDISFGKWFDASGIKLDEHHRAAAIGMGRDPKRAKEILESTERKSLRYIYELEFRSGYVAKPQPVKKVTVRVQKALDAVSRLKSQGKKITRKNVAQEAGITEAPARVAITIDQVSAVAPEPIIDPASLSITAQKRMEIYKRQLEKGIEHRVEVLARTRLEELFKARFNALDERVKKVATLLNRKFPFSRVEFKKVLMVIHPDNSASKEMRDEVFKMVNEREVILQPDVATDLSDKAREASMAELDRTFREAVARREATGKKRGWEPLKKG